MGSATLSRSLALCVSFGLLALAIGLRDEQIGNNAVYERLLARVGSQYTIGNGGQGCVGTYPAVLDTCSDKKTSKFLKDMKRAYQENEFPIAPWAPASKNNKHMILYRNEDVNRNMRELFEGYVNGIKDTTNNPIQFKTVFQLFKDKKCMALVWGGEIRDGILAAKANKPMSSMDTDVGWFCEQETVKKIVSEQEWGGSYDDTQMCKTTTPGLSCDPSEFHSTWVLLGNPTERDKGFEGMCASDNVLAETKSREFSTNAIAYDPIFGVIMDTTGAGVDDTIHKRVAFAGLKEAQTNGNNPLGNFARFNTWRIAGDPEKMYRLLKLIIPPKSYCMESMTFKLTNYHILNQWDDFVNGMGNLAHHYPSRNDAMLKSAAQMVWLYGALYGNQTKLWKSFVDTKKGLTQMYSKNNKAVPADVEKMFNVIDPASLDRSLIC